MGSFMDSGFLSSSAEQYPAFKSFEDRINILYGISSSNTDIVVYQPKHVAQHLSSDPYSTPQYVFISEA